MTAEYPEAIWRPSPNFRTTRGRTIRRIVTHVTDGSTAEGCLAWFEAKESSVSAHFVIGRDGRVWQCVRLQDVAWHARRANTDSIGIEHVAKAPRLLCTEAQYAASARLQKWLCERYGLELTRDGVLVGHSEADKGTTHTGCPASAWDWERFLAHLGGLPTGSIT